MNGGPSSGYSGPRRTRTRVHSSEVGAERARLHLDTYRVLRRAPWALLLGSLIGFFFLSNAAFAGLYWLGRPCIAHARPESFSDLFFFSVHTMATVGYGSMYPATTYANVVSTVEVIIGLTLTAVSAGIVFTKFSTPSPKLTFSKAILLNDIDGQRRVVFRIANGRATAVVDAEIRATLLFDARDPQGRYVRRMRNLPLVKQRAPLLSLTFLAEHRIDDNSALRDDTVDSLLESHAQIVVSVTGLDEHLMQVVHARYVYRAEDFEEDMRFANVVCRNARGDLIVDYRRFHDIEPW